MLTLLLSLTAYALSPVLDEPERMRKLEKLFPFKTWVADPGGGDDNRSLYKSPHYRSIVESISRDLDALLKKDRLLSVTMAKSHRLFDKRWLRSPKARFELVGVFNRLDRQPFKSPSCGEIRMIYRLAYSLKKKGHWIRSRLPLTANVVFWAQDRSGGLNCAEIARDWSKPGFLDPLRFTLSNLKAVEINMQSVRWPSTIRPDMGGYAEYLLRVFHRKKKKFVLAPLENTPDVAKLKKSPRLKKSLLKYLRDHAGDVDKGILRLPDRYLAKKATSFALHGVDRRANRPFDLVFNESDFKKIDYRALTSLKTPYAFRRKLNDLSCIGCHQGRTVAGFHFLGIDRKETSPVNFIHASSSPHLATDLQRRSNYIAALAKGQSPDPSRPFSERSPEDDGGYGSHCMATRDPSFVGWNCKEGYECKRSDHNPKSRIGECFEKGTPRMGNPCEVGTLAQSSNPHRDRIVKVKKLSCLKSHCEVPEVGFPGGMCSTNCEDLGPNETCGSIALLFEFNRCLGLNKPFDFCLKNNVRPAALRSCDFHHPCRDDYICARTLQGKGACIPPYFLFQLRVDGHPRPPI